MGSVIGKESVLEPTFKTLLERPATAQTAYHIREYGTRFVGTLHLAFFVSIIHICLVAHMKLVRTFLPRSCSRGGICWRQQDWITFPKTCEIHWGIW